MSDTPDVTLPSNRLQQVLGGKAHGAIVVTLAKHLDEGTLFKLAFVSLYSIAAWGWLVGGLLSCLAGLVGDDGYFKLGVSSAEGVGVVGTLLGGVLGVALGAFVSWLLHGLLSLRARELREIPYEGMIDFVLGKVVPRTLSTWGEVVFVLSTFAGTLTIVSALLGSAAYSPFGLPLRALVRGVMGDSIRTVSSGVVLRSSYDYFTETLSVGGLIILGGFLALVSAYLSRELWVYLMKVMTAFIRFLPRFAINLRIRQVGAGEETP